MDLNLTGKTAVVTGGSKGIGLAIATALSAEGVTVTLVARDPDTLAAARDTIAKATGTAPAVLPGDLGTDAGRAALYGALPTPDILVNNAGAIKAGRLEDLSMDDWRDGWELKVFGYIHLCKLFYPDMTKRRSGVILNVIGMGGRANRPGYICGAAGNAALIGFTNALGSASQAHGVRVLGLNPSPTLTDRMTSFFQSKARAELGDADRWEELIAPGAFPFDRPADPAEVAAMAVMLASPRVTYLSGTVVDMDGGAQWSGTS